MALPPPPRFTVADNLAEWNVSAASWFAAHDATLRAKKLSLHGIASAAVVFDPDGRVLLRRDRPARRRARALGGGRPRGDAVPPPRQRRRRAAHVSQPQPQPLVLPVRLCRRCRRLRARAARSQRTSGLSVGVEGRGCAAESRRPRDTNHPSRYAVAYPRRFSAQGRGEIAAGAYTLGFRPSVDWE
ncbi:hypothetical protein HIM_05089 [Hirsutella minnesotensis 3608]|uniref:Uncharacterized protein n=1 Tax=Hirsutella minnesotensis 3608 TaxID=1043627 RepID=A0A0F7ZKT7_9HYPO|nr:hypothetical protein HIM_05089 [Hirsutella minnesotensis 3608]